MAKLNITQAAKLVGKSRTTLYEDISEHRLSFEVNDKGKKLTDPSELARLYPDSFDLNKLETLTVFRGRVPTAFDAWSMVA